MESTQITLTTACSICRTLASLVNGGFGPRGSKTMICSCTGKVLVTADGRTILEALNLSHPLAKTIVKSAASCSANGGCCKTFLFYLTGAFEALQTTLAKQAKGDHSLDARMFGLQLSRGIQRLMSQYLVQDLPAAMKSRFSQEHRIRSELQNTCSKLLMTELSGHFTPGLCDFFTQLLINVLIEDMDCFDKVGQYLDNLVENFGNIAIKIPNQPYNISQISQGVLIPRKFVSELPSSLVSNVKFVVLEHTIEGIDNKQVDGHMIQITDSNILHRSLELKQEKAKYLLKTCQMLKIQLILSTEKVLQSFLLLCLQNCIGVVEFVPENIAEWLTSLAGVDPLYRVEELTEKDVGVAKSCGQVQFGGSTFIELCVDDPSTPVVSRQILLCAPTDGLCDQSHAVLYKALRTLHTAFDRNPYNQSHNSGIGSQNEKTVCVDISLSIADEQHMISRNRTNVASIANNLVDVAQILTPSAYINKTTEGPSVTLFTVPAGGTFEFFVEDFLNSVQRDSKDSDVLVACDVIKKAVNKVPCSLYANACSKSTTKIRDRLYVEIHKEAHQRVQQGVPVGIDSRTGHLAVISESLEAGDGKITTLFNALQLLTQILRTDRIVSVSRRTQSD